MFNCLIWAMKHELPNIFDIGLDVIDVILQVYYDILIFSRMLIMIFK